MTKRRILIIILALLFIFGIAGMIYDSAFPGIGVNDPISAPRWFITFVMIVLLYPLFIYLREEYNSEYAFEGENHRITKLKYINIDLIKKRDTKWISEIKQYHQNKEKCIAYSKEGATKARCKAKQLDIEKCFIDFKNKEEVEKDRGW